MSDPKIPSLEGALNPTSSKLDASANKTGPDPPAKPSTELRPVSYAGAEGELVPAYAGEQPEPNVVQKHVPVSWWEWRRTTLAQMLILSCLAFCGPAMGDAISNLGGGGLATANAFLAASASQYAIMAVLCFIGGLLITRFGVVPVAIVGSACFPLYVFFSSFFFRFALTGTGAKDKMWVLVKTRELKLFWSMIFFFVCVVNDVRSDGSSLYVNSKGSNTAYLIAGESIAGVGNALWYVVESCLVLSLPEAGHRGKYVFLRPLLLAPIETAMRDQQSSSKVR